MTTAPRRPSRPSLVLLDCDGVLVDSERLGVEVEARVLTGLGWALTPAEVVARWMGRTAAAQRADVAAHLGAEAAARFEELTRAAVREAMQRELVEVDGVSALLDRLEEAGVPTCVASSGTPERMRMTLGLTGLWPRLEGRIFSAVEVEHGKPAPDLFLHAAGRSGHDPAGCVVLEDSVPGVVAGVAAGMRVLGYAGGLAPADALAEAGAELFGHMDEVPALLGLP